MPFSHYHQINQIVELIVELSPRRVLDVGVGFGMYGYLARLYLELSDGRQQYSDWQRVIDGIEAFPEYVTPVHEWIYNEIHRADALTVLPTLREPYDLVLAIDVLEHFPREQGVEFLRECTRCGRNVLISTPKEYWDQTDAFGNPYETHHHLWRKADFRSFKDRLLVPNAYSLIVLIGPDAARVRRVLLKRKIRLWQRKLRHLVNR